MKYAALLLLALSTFAHADETALPPGGSVTLGDNTVTCASPQPVGTGDCYCKLIDGRFDQMLKLHGKEDLLLVKGHNAGSDLANIFECKRLIREYLREICF
jgi:hypothetical protein